MKNFSTLAHSLGKFVSRSLAAKLLFAAILCGMASSAKAQDYYVVGDGTIGWVAPNNNYDRTPTAMVNVSQNIWIWVGNIEANKRFRITDGDWGGYWAQENDGVDISNGPKVIKASKDGGDNAFKVSSDGVYKVTMNTSEMTIKAEILTAPNQDNDYYQISSVNDYYWFAGKVTSGEQTLKARMTADLVFSTSNNSDSRGFFPLACDKYKFKGEFDGDGHTISNAEIVGNNSYLGFIRYATDGANIHDLVIEGSFSGTTKVAGLIGFATGGGTVTLTNVINKAKVESTGNKDANAAGLVACAVESTIINATNCGNMGAVSGQTGEFAALAGWTQSSGDIKTTFTNCWNSGTLGDQSHTLQAYNDNGTNKYYNLYRNPGAVSENNCYDASSGNDNYGQGTKVASAELCTQEGIGHTWNSWGFCTLCNEFNTTWLIPVNGCYKIGTKEQLNWFAYYVNNVSGEAAKKINGKLIADIDYSSQTGFNNMIGKEGRAYGGTFDGQGHTVTVGFNVSNDDDCGLFRRVNGGTIKNLKVDGAITTTGKFAGGIVSGIWQRATIENCIADVNITDNNNSGDRTHGGIVARVSDKSSDAGSITIRNCAFTGEINASNATGCGGILGWPNDATDNQVKIENCLMAGTVNFVQGNDNNDIIVRNSATVTNTYYINAYGQKNSKGAIPATTEQAASGELCYKLNGNQSSINWYQNLENDADAYPVPFSFNTHAQVYANGDLRCDGSANEGSTYSNSPTSSGIPNHSFDGGDGWCTVCGALNENYLTAGEDDFFSIGTANDLKWFAEYVNQKDNTVNGKLTENIDFSSQTAMIGVSGSNTGYKGTFDGQHHKVTVGYTVNQKNVALFRTISNAHIMNLMVDGSINNTNSCSGGIFAGSHGASVVENCISYVNFTRKDGDNNIGGDATIGGIGAYMHDNGKILNCAFYGSINTPNASGNGGLLGYANGGNNIAVENCIVNATAFTFDDNVSEQNGRPVSVARNTGNVHNSYVVNAGNATQNEQISATAEQLSNGTVFASLFAYNDNGVDGSVWRWETEGTPHPVLYGNKIAMNEDCTNRMKSGSEYDVTMFRTIKTGGWNTVCLPFSLTSNQVSNYFGSDAKVAMLDNTKDGNDNVLHFKSVDEITAGQAYLVYPSEGFTQKSLGTVTIAATAPSEGLTQADFTFQGVFDPTELTANTDRIVAGGTSIVKTSGGTLKGFRAYFKTAAGARATSFVIDDDETTGIITPEGEVIVDGPVYNLGGQRVNKPQHGLYIVNGKKVVIK